MLIVIGHGHEGIYLFIYGRMVVVREPERAGEGPVDITPKEYVVRTMAQGSESGGAFRVSGDTDTLVFSNYSDQRLYKQSLTSSTIGDSSRTPLTPDYGGPIVSYADEVFDARFNRYITLREDARQSTTDPITTIVAVELDNTDIREPEVLVGGSDFYAFPRLDRKATSMTSMPSLRKRELLSCFGSIGGINNLIVHTIASR